MNAMKRYGALLLAVLLILTLALSASAAPAVKTTEGATPTFPDPGDSMISIHKYILPDSLNYDDLIVGTGEELLGTETVYGSGANARNWNSIKGDLEIHGEVGFIVKKVGQTTAWTKPPTINGTPATTFADGGYKGATDKDTGLMTIEGLEYGDYELVELSPGGYGPMYPNPIQVSVPTQLYKAGTGGGNAIDKWLYDIHVYPKNQSQGNTKKTILPPEDPDSSSVGATVGRGSEYNFEIEIELPKEKLIAAYESGANQQNGFFYIKVVDPLDGRLDFKSATVEYAPSRDTPATPVTRQPVDAADYTLTAPVKDNTADSNTLTILFNNGYPDGGVSVGPSIPPGITNLYNKVKNDADPYLYITVKTTMDPAKSSATVTVGNPGKANPDTPGDPDRNVKISWPENETDGGTPIIPDETNRTGVGDIKIDKKDGESTVQNPIPLAGAKFMIFRTEAAAKAYDPTNPAHNAAWLAERAVVNPAATSSDAKEQYTFGPTAATGLLYIRDINAWQDKTENGSTTTDYYKYWLVEVEAPKAADGTAYNMLVEPQEIEFTATNKTTKELTVEVTNNKGFILPRTGGSGTLIFTIVGLGLITVAGVALIVHMRRKRRGDEA